MLEIIVKSLIHSRFPVSVRPASHNIIGLPIHLLSLTVLTLIVFLAFDSQLALAQVIRARQVHSEMVDVYVLSGANDENFRVQISNNAMREIEGISQILDLNPDQRRKLQLAAEGDVSRFMDEISIVREKTKGLNIRNAAEVQKGLPLVNPLRERIQIGIFGDGSLLNKVISYSLTPEQLETYNSAKQEKDIAYYQAIVKATLADLEKNMPLTIVQRTAILDLIDYPKKVPKGSLSVLGQVLLADISSTELNQILDVHQRKVFNDFVGRYKGMRNQFQW